MLVAQSIRYSKTSVKVVNEKKEVEKKKARSGEVSRKRDTVFIVLVILSEGLDWAV